jgi:phosphatidate cytidylyltransferase
MAVAVGLLMAAVFTATLMWRPVAVLVLVMALLGLAAVEFYSKVAEKGYRPAVVPGLLAAVLAPAAAYWMGVTGVLLVITFAMLVTAGGFIGAESVEAGPLPNTSITMLGVVWIALMGSFAALILSLSNLGSGSTYGTDTLFLLALGVVANDVGAYFVGSAAGRSPLRKWISPAKSIEGFIGGALFTVVVLVIVGISERSSTWTSTLDLVLLALVISIMAPMGDLVESMFKRNLDTKDFGTAIRGHGGVLDRFDGFLFALPAVYYLTVVLQPWTR